MKQFLINEFGQNLGNRLYYLQKKKLQTILELTTGKSNKQMITLAKTILPRISLYKVLQEEFSEKKKAYDTLEKYMLTIVGPKLNKQYSLLEFVPGYFYIFRKIMAGTVNNSDNWITEVIKNDCTSVAYNISKCLWYDACVENDCFELCKIFCDVDHVIYGSMKKVKFIRKGTLATGNSFCDFCFLNKAETNEEMS